MRILILFLSSLFIFTTAIGQSKFYKLYSSNGFDIGKGVAEYSDSSFLISGSSTSWGGSTQVVLLKLDSTGAYEWSNQYGGTESDGSNRVLYNSSAGVYAIGYTNSIGGGDYDGLVLHTDVFGNEVWQKSFGSNTSWEFFNDAVFAMDTSIIMVGQSQDVSNGSQHIYMVRMDVNGNEIWSKTMTTYENAFATSITSVQDSLFVVGGAFYSQDSLNQKGFVMKINMNGDVLWHQTAGNLSGEYSVKDVSLGPSKVYVVGARKLSEDDHDFFSATYDFDGNAMVDTTEIDNTEIRNYIGDEICFISNVNSAIVGRRTIDQFTYQDDYDVNISYYTANNLNWLNNFANIRNAGLDEVGQILETSDGGFITVGQTTYPMSGGRNIFVFKAGPDGTFPVTADYFTIDTLVGMTETDIYEASLFPNPSNGEFQLSASFIGFEHVFVYDALGHLVWDKLLLQKGIIDLSEFQDGFYYAKINQKLFKLIKSSH